MVVYQNLRKRVEKASKNCIGFELFYNSKDVTTWPWDVNTVQDEVEWQIPDPLKYNF